MVESYVTFWRVSLQQEGKFFKYFILIFTDIFGHSTNQRKNANPLAAQFKVRLE